MSTRAVYTFIEGKEAFHVYGHSDGYPSEAINKIDAAIPFAWRLPRFEAMDFAAAFVRGNKEEGGGGIYLTASFKNHGDLDYRYEISFGGAGLWLKAFSTSRKEKCFYDGPHALFRAAVVETKMVEE